jgi:rod shape-determining protein MreD
MARLLYGLLLVVAAFAQATLLPAWGPLQVQPNLVLVLVLVWSAARGVAEGVLWAFAVGLLLDLLALDRLGTNGLALLVVVLLAGFARRRLFRSGLVFPFVLTVVAALLHPLVLLLIGGATGRGTFPDLGALRIVAPQALLCALFVPPLYLVASRFNRRLAEA